MRKYLEQVLPKLQQFSKELDDLALLVDQPWVQVSENVRTVFVFRKNGDLLVSRNGDIGSARWEYLPSLNSIVLERDGRKTLYNKGYFDDAIMALKKDGSEDYLLLGNENKLTVATEAEVMRILNLKSEKPSTPQLVSSHDPSTSRSESQTRQTNESAYSDIVFAFWAMVIIVLVILFVVSTNPS